MSIINAIEQAIVSLDGGKYQKLMDAYLMKKYRFSNIHPLGVQTGTDKPTKGIPDSYVECDDGQYILIMYGSVEAVPFSKLRDDILSCRNKEKLDLPIEKIKKIICAYTSTNLHIEQLEELKSLIPGVTIELIGLGTVAHDLTLKYRFLAQSFLNIPIDSGQVFDIEAFMEQYDANGMNAPLNIDFMFREEEIVTLKEKILTNDVVVVSGPSGVGKTKLVLEACKHIRTEKNMNIVCVKNNGMSLYNDIRSTIDEPGEYLLFLDDANCATNLDSIFEFYTSKKIDDEINVKIVMTVRDYAIERIKKLALNKVNIEDVFLKSLSIESIETILKDKLGIKNSQYLNQICSISKGNIRLAILAAMAAKDNGYKAINNSTDIFYNFYKPIFDETKVTENEICVLLALSIFGPTMIEPNDGIQYILSTKEIFQSDFVKICHRLNDCELLEIYEDSVIKITDQSFSNYILYYALIDKKVVSINELLLHTFPKYSSKLVYAINTILKLFNETTTIEYMEKEINEAWNQCHAEDETEYVTVFGAVNEGKTLVYAKRKIDESASVICGLDANKFSKEAAGSHSNDKIVEILTNFGASDLYCEAVELLMLYFEKRPDLGPTISRNIAEKMKRAFRLVQEDYERERYVISKIYQRYLDSHNENFAVLLIFIIKEFLLYEYNSTESGITANSITLTTHYLNYSDSLIEARKEMWNCLGALRLNPKLQQAVDDVIASLHPSKEGDAKEIFFEDVMILRLMFDDGVNVPDFDLSIALGTLADYAIWLGQGDSALETYLYKNKEYAIYKVLIRERLNGESWREEKEKRKAEIEHLIEPYGYAEFESLFNICKKCENKKLTNSWNLQESVDYVFDLLENNPERYIIAVKAYFEAGTPYDWRVNKKIAPLFGIISHNSILEMIEVLDISKKAKWKCAYFEELPETQIFAETANHVISFIKEQRIDDTISIPTLDNLVKYKNKGVDVVAPLIQFLLEVGETKSFLIVEFLERSFDEENVDRVIDFFEEDVDALLQLYLLAMENQSFDYGGILLARLIQYDVRCWSEISKKVSGNRDCNIDYETFDKIWLMDNYHQLIDTAYEIMRSAYLWYLNSGTIMHMFASRKDNKPLIAERKESWVKEYVELFSFDEEKTKDIFKVIAIAFPQKRIEYIKLFLERNKDINAFKKIPIFPGMRSWSGSEVPLIEKDIDFLEKLEKEMVGIDFLEHRLFIQEWIKSQEKYKQKVLKEEYLREF